MLKKKLQDGIIVKTKTGNFRILKNGKLVEIEETKDTDIIVPQDDLITLDKKIQDKLLNKLNKKPTANFYIDVSDEHEVSQFKEKGSEEKNKAIRDFIEDKAVEIISHAGLGQEAIANKQLKNIIISRIRDVRSLAETKEALKELNKKNNISTDDDWINVLMVLIEKDRDRVAEMIRTGNIPKKDKLEINKINLVKTNSKPINKMMDIKYNASSDEIGNRKKAIKNMVMGPVDEIRNISLADFRKLAKTPAEAADKIYQQISLLEDESLIKRAQGVIAWRESEIYKVYLKIGATSMSQKKTIEQVIREFREKGEPYLAPEEFNVVADLNRKLLY